ncbi:FAD-dependent oxidoreductase [Granulicella sp. dw_53]|uniref:FAD-dependent oxidoreductase n=1 Tax=Granulicella sp. dw_53 TaxID=2719792 RepID=UPI001BD43939|nr:FAD-dependent oxidoreductase [Granulicella sp. dw_53]
MNRRDFLQGSGSLAGLGLVGCARRAVVGAGVPGLPFYDAVPVLAPIRAHEDRIFRITVCLRPFRAEGPRLDVERVGDAVVVHNYGHGGSGWSLSWGSSTIAVRKAMEAVATAGGSKDVAVIGAGALGLTSASLLQRAGAKVTIYAKEQAPFVRSSRATGSWTPDSRVALTAKAAPGFGALWEEMARTSFAMYQSYLGMAGNPIEYTDRYALSDLSPQEEQAKPREPERIEFAQYRSRIRDLTPRPTSLPPGSHPFPTKYAWRSTSLTFNVADYSRQLTTDFLIAGGKIETTEFHTPSELSALPQKVIINCTGYGARALWKDESITPVRGQIAWLIPQPEVNYGLGFGSLNVLARRDGIVMQTNEQGDATGWNDANETPDRGEADRAVQMLAAMYARMAVPAGGRRASA